MALSPVRKLSWFSGCGWLDLAVKIAVPRSVAVGYVEREAYAAATLVARMEDEALDRAPLWDDAGTFPCELYCDCVDLLVAGFPCPPVSVAGKRAGIEDERWLWPLIVGGVRKIKPQWIFLENVGGLLSANAGREFGEILRDLARLGYDVEWLRLPARDVGAAHERERVFILAHSLQFRRGERAGRKRILEGRSRKERVLAEPQTRGLGELRQPSRRDGLAHRSDEELADAGSQSSSPQRQLESSERPGVAGQGGEDVAVPVGGWIGWGGFTGPRAAWVEAREQGDGPRPSDEPRDGSEGVADAASGPEGRKPDAVGQPVEGRADSGSDGAELADPHFARQRVGGKPDESQLQPGNESDGCYEEVLELRALGIECEPCPDNGTERGDVVPRWHTPGYCSNLQGLGEILRNAVASLADSLGWTPQRRGDSGELRGSAPEAAREGDQRERSGDAPRDRGEEVADAADDHGRSGVGGAEEGTRSGELGRRGSSVGGGSLEDAERVQPELAPGIVARRGDAGSAGPSGDASKPGGELVDAPSARHDGSEATGDDPAHEGERTGGSESERGRRELADAGGERHEGQLQGGPEARPIGRGDGSEIPIFAPGPSDPAWPGIVASCPQLSPAIEPGFRVLADGVPLVVDAGRADQLRLGGNGVVALQGAAALVELDRRLGSGLVARD